MAGSGVEFEGIEGDRKWAAYMFVSNYYLSLIADNRVFKFDFNGGYRGIFT